MAGRGEGTESGQASIEAALTLPLTIFLVLGTVQLFLMLQGRLLAEYAVFRATRAGSINQADCRVMTHAAVAALLPAIARTDSPDTLAAAFRARGDNRYAASLDRRDGPIVWLVSRLDRELGPAIQETFDDRHRGDARAELQLDLIFWFPLKIPFADWVMSRMFLAYWGLRAYDAANPLLPTEANAGWEDEGRRLQSARVAAELSHRTALGQLVVPIHASFRMRMMTPALQRGQRCPNSPEDL